MLELLLLLGLDYFLSRRYDRTWKELEEEVRKKEKFDRDMKEFEDEMEELARLEQEGLL